MSIRIERRRQPKKRSHPAVVRKQKINKKRALNSYVQVRTHIEKLEYNQYNR